jgi:TFIIF-interacting CTD phosphatase-like protein
MIRPGAIRFLQKLNKLFEIVIFTASVADYAKAVIEKLDKDKIGIQSLSRDH